MWKNDRQNGKGLLTLPNGDVIDALWADGKIVDGDGVVKYSIFLNPQNEFLTNSNKFVSISSFVIA
jgi:hypothetical protein